VTIATDHGGMGGGLVPGIYPPPRAMRPTLVGERWAVVAGHPRVSQVAAQIFCQGGNAVDAGVAAGIASNVVQVDMANFGGIAPVIIRPAGSNECWSVAGVGRWSRSASIEAMVERHHGALPLDGAPAIIPGAPAGWLKSLAEFGTMSLSEVAAPAIALAREGFLLDEKTALSLALMGRKFSRWKNSNTIYRPNGVDLVYGDRLKQLELADLLETLVAAEQDHRGDRKQRIKAAHDCFYRGRIALRITEWVTEQGGFMTTEDLAEFDAEVELSPSVDLGEWKFFSTPSWSQGPVALAILGILERGGGSLHEIVEAITLAFNDREDYLAEPARMKVPIEELLSDQHLAELASMIGNSALAGRSSSQTGGETRLSTTSIVTMEADGCCFASAPSDTLDGGPIIDGLGIMCSPRGVQSRLSPHHANSLAPWARPVVTPAALIGLTETNTWGLSCPGGDVIVQAMAQVVNNILRYDMDVQEAVEAPRLAAFNAPSAFHPHPSADRLVFAEGRIPADDLDQLRLLGHNVEVWPNFEFDAGSVQTILQRHNNNGEKYLLTGADPRRSAYALAE